MRVIKFNPEFIPLIKAGRKTSTVRLHKLPEHQPCDIIRIEGDKAKLIVNSVTVTTMNHLSHLEWLPEKEGFEDHHSMIKELLEIYPQASNDSTVHIYEFEVM